MKIKKLHISNFKSIKELELINPNPFSVFVGPNGAGKSNIFEALEYGVFFNKFGIDETIRIFGGQNSVFNFQLNSQDQHCQLTTYGRHAVFDIRVSLRKHSEDLYLWTGLSVQPKEQYADDENFKKDYAQYVSRFSKIFLKNSEIKKINSNDNSFLNLDASNIENVLQRVLLEQNAKQEIIEWLQVLVPEFNDIQIDTSSLSGDVNYVIYEKHANKPFPKHLISDGTKNILALLTAVYQSDEPQFLCIEEPENGLHPYVIESLVGFFRNACKEKGHFIWLNTHSATLVRQLTVDEIIVVDKKEGATRVRQFQGQDLYGLKMDEAWLTNALGGGLP